MAAGHRSALAAAARGRGDDGGGGEEQDRDGDEHERGGSVLRRRAFFGESSGSLDDNSVSAARFEELREFEARHAALKAIVNSPRPPARHSVVVGRWPSLLRASAKTFRSRRFSSFASTAEEAAAAAIAAARIGRVYYGASDPKSGGVAHGARVFSHPQAHHSPEVYDGIAEVEAEQILKVFFAARR